MVSDVHPPEATLSPDVCENILSVLEKAEIFAAGVFAAACYRVFMHQSMEKLVRCAPGAQKNADQLTFIVSEVGSAHMSSVFGQRSSSRTQEAGNTDVRVLAEVIDGLVRSHPPVSIVVPLSWLWAIALPRLGGWEQASTPFVRGLDIDRHFYDYVHHFIPGT